MLHTAHVRPLQLSRAKFGAGAIARAHAKIF